MGLFGFFFYPEGIDLHARIPFHSIPSLRDGLIYTEILSQRAVKPKQPSYQLLDMNLIPRTNLTNNKEPANAAMHGPHSLVRIGPGCAGRALLQ